MFWLFQAFCLSSCCVETRINQSWIDIYWLIPQTIWDTDGLFSPDNIIKISHISCFLLLFLPMIIQHIFPILLGTLQSSNLIYYVKNSLVCHFETLNWAMASNFIFCQVRSQRKRFYLLAPRTLFASG